MSNPKDSSIINPLYQDLLTRGVEEIIDGKNLVAKLEAGKTLRVKLGIDPTSPNIHLGRSIPLLKLRDFQALGHQVILIIGNFTGVIGDTSDKDSERPMLSEATIAKNLETYIEQAGKIIDITKAEIRYNADWLTSLGYAEIGKQADQFSLNEFISRENIAKRLEAGKRVSLRELLYPLMQGYDSVEVQADVEVGGTDQRFNLLTGRDLQRLYHQEAQDIITNPLIEGLDGRKMSSSFGNTVNLLDTPNDMYGKLMGLSDELIIKYFQILTRVSWSQIKEYERDLTEGVNPREIKMKLAYEIVSMYHSVAIADRAQDYFIQTFTKREIPADIPEFKPSNYDLVSILLESGLAQSKSEIRRLIDQKGIKVNGEIITNYTQDVPIEAVIQKGKIHFLKVI